MNGVSEVQLITERNGEPCHEYWLGKCRIPSVSEIIRPCVNFDGIKKSVIENAREFGTCVDIACQYHDEGDLDEDTLEPRVRLRLNGWIKFKKEFEFRPLVIAKSMSHEMNGMPYGLTPDRYGEGSPGKMVVDIKNTHEIEPHHGLQLAGYEDAFIDGGKYQVGRYIVQLLDNDYKIVEFKDRQEKRIFAGLLAVAHWKLQKGIKL